MGAWLLPDGLGDTAIVPSQGRQTCRDQAGSQSEPIMFPRALTRSRHRSSSSDPRCSPSSLRRMEKSDSPCATQSLLNPNSPARNGTQCGCFDRSSNRWEVIRTAATQLPRFSSSRETTTTGCDWAGEKLVLTELEGRFRDTCFCCAGWNDVASERSLSPPCDGGAGGVMREPWKSKTILLASREGRERTERERAREDLVTGRAGTTPPNPPCKGSEFRVFGIAVNSYATSRIGRLSNHNMEKLKTYILYIICID